MTKASARALPLAKATIERGRLAAAQANLAEIKAAKLRGSLVDAAEVEAAWGGVLRTVRASMLAVPSRCAARLPHLSKHDVAEIDAEIRAALVEIGTSSILG
jgi:phage terminase Nu1 subunit (DNA packaging protein)